MLLVCVADAAAAAASRRPSDISSASVVNPSSSLAFWCRRIFSLPSCTAVVTAGRVGESLVSVGPNVLRLFRRSCTCMYERIQTRRQRPVSTLGLVQDFSLEGGERLKGRKSKLKAESGDGVLDKGAASPSPPARGSRERY